VLVPVTFSDVERWGMRDQNFLADLRNFACTVWSRTTKFGLVTQVE